MPQTFSGEFGKFADAPEALTKMRELVLRLAMQGKLSERQDGDIPVADLLFDISEEKSRTVGSKSIRGTTAQTEVSEHEITHPIPPRWSWVLFGVIAQHNAGKTLDKGRNSGEPRDYITTSNLYSGSFQLDDVRQMLIREEELERCTAKKGDLLICEGGEAGRAAVWPYEYDISFQNHIHRARFYGGIDPYFVYRFFEKLNATGEINRHRKGVGISNMSGKALAAIVLPLPPVAEQQRIVARVDELMALCDRLEAQQQERDRKHTALARASLARFAEAPNPANLNFLFHKSYDINPGDLRKSVLTLAVQGKLVPQDPDDEPAEELLERLARESAPEQRRGRAKLLPPLAQEHLQFHVPNSWTWRRFHDAAVIASNLVKPEGYLDFPHLAPDNIEKGNGVLLPCRTIKEDKVRSSNHRFYAGQIVYSKIRPNLSKVVLVEFDGLCSADMYPINVLIDARYLHRYMLSEPFLLQAVKTDTRVAMPKINQAELNAIAVPVPPLAEQRRIVAKTDQLLALVDELEMQVAVSHASAENLLKAVVAELTADGAPSPVINA